MIELTPFLALAELDLTPIAFIIVVASILYHCLNSESAVPAHGRKVVDAVPRKNIRKQGVFPKQPEVINRTPNHTAAKAVDGNCGWMPFANIFSCCLARPDARVNFENMTSDNPPDDADQRNRMANHTWSLEDVLAAGVPQDTAEDVVKFAITVGATAPEPLSDPTTLWRFMSAREFDEQAAKEMYENSIKWRSSVVQPAMLMHGTGELYDKSGCRVSDDPTSWKWRRDSSVSAASAAVQRYGFFGKLSASAPDGSPIGVWRLGTVDIAGYVREDLLDVMSQGFIAHLEDLLQAGRAESRRQGKIVRVRLIIDAQGLGISHLRRAKTFQPLLGLGKLYYPEVTVSCTVIRAARAFTTVYETMKHFLTPVMKRKICILGNDFAEGLQEHSGLHIDCLPNFLGGLALDCEVCEAASVPRGFGTSLK